jgi:hypothetical protein
MEYVHKNFNYSNFAQIHPLVFIIIKYHYIYVLYSIYIYIYIYQIYFEHCPPSKAQQPMTFLGRDLAQSSDRDRLILKLRFSNSPPPSRATVAMQNICTYQQLLQILMPAVRIQDTVLPRCFTGWQVWISQPEKQQGCGNIKFRTCRFSNLTRLDDSGESIYFRTMK